MMRVKRVLSILLCLCMLLQNAPLVAFAAAEDNLCEHHTEHTAECGYAEGESDCTYHCDLCLGHDHDEEEQETTAPSSEATEPSSETTEPAPVCSCGTDDPAIHATTCAVYVAPENPQCFCAEKCTEPNVWCDVCGFDIAACGGEGEAASFVANPTGKAGLLYTGSDQLLINATEADSGYKWGYFAYGYGGEPTVFLPDEWTPPERAEVDQYTVHCYHIPDTLTGFEALLDYCAKNGIKVTVYIYPSVTTAPVGATGLYANGSAQTLISAEGVPAGGYGPDMLYSVTADSATSPGSFSTSLPTATEAGTYKVWYKARSQSATAWGSKRLTIDAPNSAAQYITVTIGRVTTNQITWILEGETYATTSQSTGQKLTLPDTPTKAPTDCVSYTFDGWFTAAQGGERVTAETVYSANTDATYYGRFTKVNTHDPALASYSANGFCLDCDAYEPAELVDGVYEISNAGQLYWFAQQVNSGSTAINGELTADIKVNDHVLTADGTLNGDGSAFRAWTPIGTEDNAYTGEFRGSEHTVSGLYVNGSADYVGLFGYVGSGGTVENVGVIDSYFKAGSYVGGVAGCNRGTLQYVYNTGNINGSSCVGGVVGENNYIVQYAYNTGTVFARDNAGGVVGENNYILEYAYNTGSASDWFQYGSVTGSNRDATKLKNCYYLADSETDELDGTTAKTAGQFEIGEVAYLLGAPFGQNIGTHVSPVLNLGYTVYQVHNCKNETIYSNTNANIGHTGGTATCTAQAVCTVCGASYGELAAHSTTAEDDIAADCNSKAYCSVCQSEYGEVDTTNHDETVAFDSNGFCPHCDAYEPAVLNNGVYEISNAGQLYWFAAKCNDGEMDHDGKLMADIVVNPGTFATDGTYTPKNGETVREWTPIGYFGYAAEQLGYTGSFDGDGHTISGLYFNDANAYSVGLFGFVEVDGEVQNVGVVDSYFSGRYYVGGVVGSFDGIVTNCYNTGTVSGSYYVGGVVGSLDGIVTNCYNTGTVSGSDHVGGVVGISIGTVTGCHNTGTVSGSSYTGGVMGYNEGTTCTMTNCYNTGTVTGSDFVGGVMGKNKGTITGCHNTGTVSGSDLVGGVVGSNEDTITGCHNTGTVSGGNYVGGVVGLGSASNCYNTGTVTGSDNVGGVMGVGSASNCYYLDSCGAAGNGTAKTAEQFASGEVAYLLSQGENGSIWGQTIGTDPAPVFSDAKVYYGYTSCGDDEKIYTNDSSVSAEKPSHDYDNGFCTVCDAYEPAELLSGVYQISNAGQLYWFADKVTNENAAYGSADAILTCDIRVNSGTMTESSTGARVWTPIGKIGLVGNQVVRYPYTGTFEGNGKTVSGLYFNDTSANFDVGLFSYVGEGGTVQNVGIADSYLCGSQSIGAVVGNNFGTVTGCYNTGTVIISGTAGGVVGANSGTVTDCSNTGTVSGSYYVGGVVGSSSGSYTYGSGSIMCNAIVTDCYNTGAVSGTTDVGGVVGHNGAYGSSSSGIVFSTAIVTDCHNTGTVSGKNNVGGVVGAHSGIVTGCYNTGTVSGTSDVGGVVAYNNGIVMDCYHSGSISGTTNVGGVAGRNSGATPGNTAVGTVTNCYFDSTVYAGDAIGTNEGTATNVEGKTTEQFASGEVAYLLSQGENGSIWGQTIGTDPAPIFSDAKVYYGYTSCGDTEADYTNEEATEEKPDHTEQPAYTDNHNGTHSFLYPCCGTVVASEGHTFDETGKCPCTAQAAASVTIGGTTTCYETLAEAIRTAENCTAADNAVMKLLKEHTGSVAISSGVFTLDLNGQTISSDTHGLETDGTVELTITDSSDTPGTIRAGATAHAIWHWGGSVTIEKGNLIGSILVRGGVLTMKDGVVETDGSQAVHVYGGQMLLQGGTLKVYNTISLARIDEGELIISGSPVLEGEDAALRFCGGTMDLSGMTDPTGLVVRNESETDVPAADIPLPEGYFFWQNGAASETLLDSSAYTIGQTAPESPEPPVNPDEPWDEFLILVAGNLVTEDNCADILEDGTVSYDPETNVLTLNNADIVTEGFYGIYSNVSLTIELTGENTIETDYGAIFFDNPQGESMDAVITGTGSLTAVSGNIGIEMDGARLSMTLSGSADITLWPDNDEGINLYGTDCDLVIRDSARLTMGSRNAPLGEEGIYIDSEETGSVTIQDSACITIFTDDEEGIYVGGYQESLAITGGTVYIEANEEALDSNTIAISGGTVTAIGGIGYEGIFADDLTISGGSVLAGTVKGDEGDGVEADHITITGGTLQVISGGLIASAYDENGKSIPGTITLGEGMTISEPQGGKLGQIDLTEAGEAVVQAVLNADGTFAHALVITDGETAAPNVPALPEIPDAYLAGIPMYSGDYLAVGADAVTDTQPAGGYAYCADGVLTLHDFVYEGEGYDSDGYGHALYSVTNLKLVLEGENSLTCVGEYTDAILVDNNLTVSGSGTLALNAEYALYVGNNMTMNGGTIYANGTMTGLYVMGELTVKGGSIAASGGYGVSVGDGMTMTGGSVTISGTPEGRGLYVYDTLTITGGRLEITAGGLTVETYDPEAGGVVPGTIILEGVSVITPEGGSVGTSESSTSILDAEGQLADAVLIRMACDHGENVDKTYTPNDDGKTHTITCACGETYTAVHDYTDDKENHKCVCGVAEQITVRVFWYADNAEPLWTLVEDYGTITTIPTGAAPQGYTLKGYARTKDGEVFLAVPEGGGTPKYTYTESIDLYPVFEINSHRLTVTGLNGEELVSVDVDYGANVADLVPIDKYEVNKYYVNQIGNGYHIFRGWIYETPDIYEWVEDTTTMPDHDLSVCAEGDYTGWILQDEAWTYEVANVAQTGLTRVIRFDHDSFDPYALFADDFGWAELGEDGIWNGKYINETFPDYEDGLWILENGTLTKAAEDYTLAKGQYLHYIVGGIDQGGLQKVGDDYYFFASTGHAATGRYTAWATRCDLPVGTYEFGSDGRMLRGLVQKDSGIYYYVNGNIGKAGLTKIGEDYYFVSTIGRVATGQYYCWATNCDLPCGNYEFGSDGKMLQGIVMKDNGPWLYKNGKPDTSRPGITKIGDDFYFVSAIGRCAVGNYYCWATNCSIPVGNYHFDEQGRMTNPPMLDGDDNLFTGLVEKENGIYYYVNGKYGPAGLTKIGEHYYFVSSIGRVATGQYYCWATNCDLPCGNYTFDDQGRMMNPPVVGEDGKLFTGLREEANGIYYYVDGKYGPAGLTKIGEHYYFVSSIGRVATGQYYCWATNCDLPCGLYNFAADGKMIR